MLSSFLVFERRKKKKKRREKRKEKENNLRKIDKNVEYFKYLISG